MELMSLLNNLLGKYYHSCHLTGNGDLEILSDNWQHPPLTISSLIVNTCLLVGWSFSDYHTRTADPCCHTLRTMRFLAPHTLNLPLISATTAIYSSDYFLLQIQAIQLSTLPQHFMICKHPLSPPASSLPLEPTFND